MLSRYFSEVSPNYKSTAALLPSRVALKLPSDASKCERFTYDYRNRLIKIEHSENYDQPSPTWTLVANYYYDGLNRRVKKVLQSGTDVLYLYDGWQCIEEREYDNPNWEARRQYVYGGMYIDEPCIFDKDNNNDGDCTDDPGTGSLRFFYGQNANYNVVAVMESDGDINETYKYDPYGECTVTVAAQHSASGNP